MSDTLHCRNWKASEPATVEGIKAVCDVRRPAEAFAKVPGKITCDRCSLRVLREGQNRGLDIEKILTWTWADLGVPVEGCNICGDPKFVCELPDGTCRYAKVVKIGRIDVGQDFSHFPAGAKRTDGEYSGEHFRAMLVAALNTNEVVHVVMDGTLGYGSSFLQEAFGGLVTHEGFKSDALVQRLIIESADTSIIYEIKQYFGSGARLPLGRRCS